MDHLAVESGIEILRIVPVARLSTIAGSSIEKAHSLLRRYERAGVPRERILIKFASTSDGIKVAELLVKEGVNCNSPSCFPLPMPLPARRRA